MIFHYLYFSIKWQTDSVLDSTSSSHTFLGYRFAWCSATADTENCSTITFILFLIMQFSTRGNCMTGFRANFTRMTATFLLAWDTNYVTVVTAWNRENFIFKKSNSQTKRISQNTVHRQDSIIRYLLLVILLIVVVIYFTLLIRFNNFSWYIYIIIIMIIWNLLILFHEPSSIQVLTSRLFLNSQVLN